jgi:hypothetical protein
MSLPITLIFLIPNSQPGWADCIYPYCSRGPGGLGSPIRRERDEIETKINKGIAKAADYLRAGEIYTQLGDKAMAETRFNQSRGLYNKLGDRQGVMKVDQKQQMLNSPLQRQTAPEIQMPGQNQIQQGR